MPPSATEVETIQLRECEDPFPKLLAPQAAPRQYTILYPTVAIVTYGHLVAVHAVYLATTTALWRTLIFSSILYILAGIGVMAGAHRLWSHRAYKAKRPLQILLMLMHSLAYQNTVIDWVTKHRMHHRYTDTDADPHNSTRGFFYSHIGWILVKKHPEGRRREKFIDTSDVYSNPVLLIQKRYAIPLIVTTCFVAPTLIPVYFFGETLYTAWSINVLRFALNLHTTFSINSAAHLWGSKPYDRAIKPVQNLAVSFMALGEGFHNYHHTFPWDYRAAELGNNWLNVSAKFIDFFAWVGWAYDLKTVPEDMVHSRAVRTGDGTNMWGY